MTLDISTSRSAKQGAGRPRKFDRDDVVAKAMRVHYHPKSPS